MTVKTEINELQQAEQSDAKLKGFSDYYSIVQKQEDLLAVVNIIDSSKFKISSILEQYKGKNFYNLYDSLLHDETKGKKVFKKLIQEETYSGIALLRDLKNILEAKLSEEDDSYKILLKKKEELHSAWRLIAEEKEKLQGENKRMSLELDEFLKKKDWLVSKKEYLNYKYNEYGDDSKINELFLQWSEDHKKAKAEKEQLELEYEKAGKDEKTIPRLCSDIRADMKAQKEEMALAKSEVENILKTIPDIIERAKESEEIVIKYNAVHKDYQAILTDMKEFREKFRKVDEESKELDGNLSRKKDEIAPFLKDEASLKEKLLELTNKFNRQEELSEEKGVLNQVIKPLEKKLKEWKDKIENHEKKTSDINKEIETLKTTSHKTVSELKEIEAVAGPVKDLKERQEKIETESPLLVKQIKKLTEGIHTMRKENEILSIKAKQFEMINKKLGNVK